LANGRASHRDKVPSLGAVLRRGPVSGTLGDVMRAVPKSLNLDAFIGSEITQIRLGLHNLQFHFGENHNISCEGRVSVRNGLVSHVVYSDSGWQDITFLPHLLGKIVVSWSVESSHVFSVTLNSSVTVLFESADSPYEDFVIDNGACVA
jgi:hypothetical protein